MFALAHEFLDLGEVVFLANVLVLFENLHTCAAVSCSNVLNELGSISDQLAFERVHKWARTAVEAIGATDRVDVLAPILIGFNDDLNADIWAVILEELAEHLTLW